MRYLRRTNPTNKTLPKATIIFLSFCIIGIIAHNMSAVTVWGQTFFAFFLVAEIAYLWYVMNISLKKAYLRLLFSGLLITTFLAIPYLTIQTYKPTLYDPLFAVESLVATSISFAYFIQLGTEIKNKNVLEESVTLIMLGLFFCYSLPFSYNTTISVINFMKPEMFDDIKASKFDHFLLVSISRVGTICYIILNIFFYKAFKWKTKIQVGT